MEILQTVHFTEIETINEKFTQQIKKGSVFHWKRTFCIRDKQDKKIAMISLNIFERMIWSCLPHFFSKYSKLKEIFPISEKIENISHSHLIFFLEFHHEVANMIFEKANLAVETLQKKLKITQEQHKVTQEQLQKIFDEAEGEDKEFEAQIKTIQEETHEMSHAMWEQLIKLKEQEKQELLNEKQYEKQELFKNLNEKQKLEQEKQEIINEKQKLFENFLEQEKQKKFQKLSFFNTFKEKLIKLKEHKEQEKQEVSDAEMLELSQELIAQLLNL